MKTRSASRRSDVAITSAPGKVPAPALSVEFVQHVEARKRGFIDAAKQCAALSSDMDREDVSSHSVEFH